MKIMYWKHIVILLRLLAFAYLPGMLVISFLIGDFVLFDLNAWLSSLLMALLLVGSNAAKYKNFFHIPPSRFQSGQVITPRNLDDLEALVMDEFNIEQINRVSKKLIFNTVSPANGPGEKVEIEEKERLESGHYVFEVNSRSIGGLFVDMGRNYENILKVKNALSA